MGPVFVGMPLATKQLRLCAVSFVASLLCCLLLFFVLTDPLTVLWRSDGLVDGGADNAVPRLSCVTDCEDAVFSWAGEMWELVI